jgi:hypothetical protein
MGTATINGALVLEVPTQILGPGSEYDKRRIALKKDAEQLVLDAKKIVQVASAEEEEAANNAGRVLQAETKEIELFFKPIKQQIDGFKAPVLLHEKELGIPIDAEKKRIGGLITEWKQQCAREQEERDRKAREEAERQAREDQLARAIELEASGDKEAAAQVLEEPIFAPAVTQSEAAPKLAGQVGRMTYSATVVDFRTLLKAVAEGRAPLQCLVADESYLNGKARLEKDGFNVPGVRLNKTPSTNFRS